MRTPVEPKAPSRKKQLKKPKDLGGKHSVSLQQRAYDYIKEGVITYRYKPGQSIFENEIAEELGMSKTPVREALQQLEKRDFVMRRPYRDTCVKAVNLKDIKEIFEIRENLEVPAVKAACGRMKKEGLGRLRELTKLMLRAGKRNEFQTYMEADQELHGLILETAGNEKAYEIICGFNEHIQRVRYLATVRSPRLPELIREHVKLFRAIERGDVEAAARLMRKHLRDVLGDIEKFAEYGLL